MAALVGKRVVLLYHDNSLETNMQILLIVETQNALHFHG